MTRPTDSEVLDVLTDGELVSSYAISRRIELHWQAEGRRSRFLFWRYDPIIGHGTIFRVLDALVAGGAVIRRKNGRGGEVRTGMTRLRIVAFGAVAVSAAIYLHQPTADNGTGLAVFGASLVMLIGPLRILKFMAGLALMFLAFG